MACKQPSNKPSEWDGVIHGAAPHSTCLSFAWKIKCQQYTCVGRALKLLGCLCGFYIFLFVFFHYYYLINNCFTFFGVSRMQDKTHSLTLRSTGLWNSNSILTSLVRPHLFKLCSLPAFVVVKCLDVSKTGLYKLAVLLHCYYSGVVVSTVASQQRGTEICLQDSLGTLNCLLV